MNVIIFVLTWTLIALIVAALWHTLFRDERGEAHSEYISNLSSSHVSDRFRLINDEYHDLAKQVDAAAKANQKAYDKVVALKRRFAKVTPELFESAKVVAGKEIA